MAVLNSARVLIKYHEGCVLVAKPDAKGMWEIGWGHDIFAPPPGDPPPTCTQDEADSLFEQDYVIAAYGAVSSIGRGSWGLMTAPRQGVFLDMCYEMGSSGLVAFRKLIVAAVDRDWAEASRQALDSEWFKQVPARAQMDADMLLTGLWPQIP